MKQIYQTPIVETALIKSVLPIAATIDSGSTGHAIGDWNAGDEETLED